jgi:hypothetical protein
VTMAHDADLVLLDWVPAISADANALARPV